MKNLVLILLMVIIPVISLNSCCCNEKQINETIDTISNVLADQYFVETETNIRNITSKNRTIKVDEVIDQLINEKKTVTDEIYYTKEPGAEVMMLETLSPDSLKITYYYESKAVKSKEINIRE